MPKKPYLTYLDKYILSGFGCILIMGFLVGISGLIEMLNLTLDCCPDINGLLVEQVLVVAIMVPWILAHLWLACCVEKLFPTWDSVLKRENDALLDQSKRSQESRAASSRFKRSVG